MQRTRAYLLNRPTARIHDHNHDHDHDYDRSPSLALPLTLVPSPHPILSPLSLTPPSQVTKTSFQIGSKWSNFAWATLPAPLLGALCPGPISFKCIVCAATAAAQAAYYLASAE